MKRSNRRRILLNLVLVAGLAAVLAYAFVPRPLSVDLGTVIRGPLKVSIDEEGRTRVREVYVVSAPLTGRVQRVEPHVGDTVRAGKTVLASIQPTDPTFLDIRSQVQAESQVKAAEAAEALARAELQRTDAELEYAEAELKRARALALRGTISQAALDRAEMEVKTRRAARLTVEAGLRVKQFELETARASLITPGQNPEDGNHQADCCVKVKAPVSGRILRVIHESEAVVAAGTPLIEIGDPRDLEMIVELLSADAVRIREGADVAIAEWGGDGELKGRVRRIEPYGFTKVSALGIEEQRVNVVIDFTDPPAAWSALGHGFRVEVAITVWAADDVVKAPVGALFRDGETWAVFLATDGSANLRHIELGHSNGTEAEILSGLAPGDQVVLHPSDRIADQVPIEPRAAK